MTPSHLRVVTTLVVSSLLGLLSLGQAAPTRLSACASIATSGVYVVRQNLNATGNCFVIGVDNVELNLGGFTLTGDGTGTGVTDGGTNRINVTVQNGTITGFANGVNLGSSTGSSLQGLRILDNTNIGLQIGASSRVQNCVVSGATATGIEVGAGSRATGNIVTGAATGLSVACPTLTSSNILNAGTDGLATTGAGCLSVNDVEVP